MLTRLVDLIVLVAELSLSGEPLNDLDEELTTRGYAAEEIKQAVYWYSTRDESSMAVPAEAVRGIRVLNEFERLSISTECYGYLLQLLNLGIIDIEQFERIIARAIPVGPEKVQLGDVKTIASEVIFNHATGEFDEDGVDSFSSDSPFA